MYRYRATSRQTGPLQSPRRRPSRRRSPLLVAAIVTLALLAALFLWVLPSCRSGADAPPSGSASVPTEPGNAPAKGVLADTVTEPDGTLIIEGERISLAYPTYLGGTLRSSSGKGPAPSALDVIWKLEIGSGLTSRKSDDKLVTWTGTGWTGQPTVTCEDGHAYLVIGGYDHGLRRINAATGDVVWRAQLDDVIKGTNTVYYDPTRAENDRVVVVTGSRRGNQYDVGDAGVAPLRAFSFATGEELWRLPVPRTHNYSQDVDASPLVVDGRLIVAIEPGHVLALDTSRLTRTPDGHLQPSVVASSPALYTDGDVAAHAEDGGSNVALEGSPAVLGDRIYVASSSGHVYGLDRATLAIEWDFNPGGDFDSTVVVTPEGMLLVGVERQYIEHGGVFMLDPSRPADDCVVWFFSTEDRGIGEWAGGVVGSVALGTSPGGQPIAAFNSVDGHLYVVSRDVTDGTSPTPDGVGRYPRPKLLFSDHIGSSISTPAIVGDRIVTCGLDSQVHLYEMSVGDPAIRFTELDTFTASGMFESTPLIWEGRVYVGCRDGYLYCLGD